MNGRSKSFKNFGLFAALFVAGFAGACGPAAPAVTPDPNATPTPSADPVASADPVVAPPATTGATAPTAPPVTTAPPAAGPPSQPIQASKLLADVKKAGIDVTKFADLDKMPLAQKKKIMPFFQKALGYESCTGCHKAEGDFKSETRNTKIGQGCFNTFVAALRDDKGGALFCDSCHAGKSKPLARHDKEALKKFMETEYVAKLTRANKADMECSSCHGDTLELRIFSNLWKVN
jgi:hypothetical protein